MDQTAAVGVVVLMGKGYRSIFTPVVFLILPVTVLFAFWPGLVGLRLVTP